jgi:catechol 2,3-dioxygenase-like lactoylglutathione lyase family enzyme
MLQHVTQQVRPAQLDACIAFYELLGFGRIRAPEGIVGRATWLQRGSGQIHLMPSADAEPGSGHVGVVAEDYEPTIRALRSAGHDVQPRGEHWGSPRAYVRDPAGNLIEVMAFAPGSEPTSD